MDRKGIGYLNAVSNTASMIRNAIIGLLYDIFGTKTMTFLGLELINAIITIMPPLAIITGLSAIIMLRTLDKLQT